MKSKIIMIVVGLFIGLFGIQSYAGEEPIKIGWAEIDITPTESLLPIDLRGQFNARVTSTVNDPLTATALAIESDSGEQWILVSIDTLDLGPGGASEVWPMDHEGMLVPLRVSLEGTLPGFELNKLTLVATHTHTAPYLNETIRQYYPTEEIIYNPYYDFVKEKLELVVQQAWNNRAYGGLSFEKGEAEVGYCRVVIYTDGTHILYGDTTLPTFAGMLTPNDPTLELMYTTDLNGGLTGIMINIVAPSQKVEGESYISADFWYDVRQQLRQTYGNDIFILPYGGAAGDMSPRNLEGYSPTREEIGERIADSVRDRYPFAMNTIKYQVEMGHIVRNINLPTKSYYQSFHPVYGEPRTTYLVEIHALRLDNTVWVNNPFELYNAWGKAIQNGSVATQTIIAQMSGLNRGGYLPTEEAVSGGAYGGETANGWVDPLGGQQLVDNSVDMINDLFEDGTAPVARDDSVNTEEDVAVTIDVLNNDTDPNEDTLHVVSVTQPHNGLAVIDGNDAVTYTPNAGFSGSDSFTYTISDGSETDTATVTIQVGSGDENLILHWQFEESNGNIVSDSSGNNLDGALSNGPVWDNNAMIGNGALTFDGVNDYVSVDSPDLDFGADDFTVAIWVKKLEASANWDNVWGVNKWESGPDASNNEWGLTLTNGDDDLPSFAIASATTIYQISGSEDLTVGQWHHIAGVRSGNEIQLYVDGELEDSTNVGTASINNAGRELRIANSALDAFQTHGTFDDLRIYKRALTGSEIQDIMNGTIPVDTTAPVITLLGNTPIDVVQATAYTDAGATALDDVDGDITANIVTVNPVNTNTVGQYTVTYNVSDAAGNAAAQISRTVNVVQNASNTAPVANAGPDQIVVGGNTEVTLDGSDSSDVDGDDLSYSWILTVPTGSNATLTGVNNVDPTFTPDVNGTYIAQLRVNDGTTDSVLDTVAILYSSKAEALTGGICLSFDDAYVDSWYATRNLFDQYNAKVTFNLSWWEVLTEAQKQMLRDLKSDGHEIASHSLNHYDIDGIIPPVPPGGAYGSASEVERYIKEEVDPAIELMSAAGLPPVTFAIPYNADNDPYSNALLEKFSFIRGGAWVPDGSDITTIESGYYTCDDQSNLRRHVYGFAGSESIENLNAAMEHAAANDSVVLIYDHNINDNPNYSISPAKLEAILNKAQEQGLKFYTRIELQKHCVVPVPVDTTAPVITLLGNTPIDVTQGTAYTDAGATALDDVDGDITGNIVTVNPVNTNTVGQYTVTYNVSDAAGNAAAQISRTVNVVPVPVDTTAPVITLLGNTPINVTQGTAYADAGATALDDVDGDITANIVTVNPVNTNTVGQYTVTYNVSDAAGNAAAQVTRTVNVVAPSGDTTKPVITLLENTPIDVVQGTAYTDAGATALDDVDGDITANIVTVNPVNTNTVGQYTVTYNVSDAAGNAAAQISRTVNVIAAPITIIAINAGGGAYISTDETEYITDQYFSGGETYSTSVPISGTEDDTLYQTEHYGNPTYAVPVENGTYKVTIKFAEIYFDDSSEIDFDVVIEGVLAATNLDVWDQVGKNTAYDVTATVTVNDGELNISANNIKAIKISEDVAP